MKKTYGGAVRIWSIYVILIYYFFWRDKKKKKLLTIQKYKYLDYIKLYKFQLITPLRSK